jgi:hypothetical protein
LIIFSLDLPYHLEILEADIFPLLSQPCLAFTQRQA